MKMQEIRKKAKEMGVKGIGTRRDIIRSVQTAEGNTPCFGTKQDCMQKECCWWEDCQTKDSQM